MPWENPNAGMLGDNTGYKVKTRDGTEKEEYGYAFDALTVRWSDIRDVSIIVRVVAE